MDNVVTVTDDTATILWEDPVPTFTYLAGAAGSGKTFAVREWAQRDRGVVLAATTGIASVNLGAGTTINALLHYFDTKSLQDHFLDGRLTACLGSLWRSGVRRIVLDEVSMLDADQLTYLVRAIEEVNNRGYVLDSRWQDDTTPPALGLTLVGDFAQLSPVKACYAFESPEWAKFRDHTITLTEIRRQADPGFIAALRAARRGEGEAVVEYFRPSLQDQTDDGYDGPTILAKNEAVDRYNQLRLDRVPGSVVGFRSSRWGKQRSEWGNPEKPPSTWGIPETLQLKVGALVMILANAWTEGKGRSRRLIYANGDLGTIVEANPATYDVIVRLQRTGDEVGIGWVTREVKVPADAERRKELRALGLQDRIDEKWEILGGITYLPLRIAYAATVHKSQGLSLDRAQVNLRDSFFRTPGMVYVALSRARTAEGLRIVGSPEQLRLRCTSDPRLKAWL